MSYRKLKSLFLNKLMIEPSIFGGFFLHFIIAFIYSFWIKGGCLQQNTSGGMYMIKRIISIFLFSMAGYFIFQNRYRVMNSLLGNAFLRRFAVSSLLGLPGVRNKIFQTVFASPSELG
jgi:hypothetical protein